MGVHPLAASFPLLDETALSEISALTESVKLKEQSVLLEENTEADAMYLITDGVATVTKNLAGVEIVIAELSEGELVGEMSFAGNIPATATVRAASDLEAIRIDKVRLLALLNSNSALGMGVYRSIALTLSRRLLQMTERFASLST